MRFLSGTSLATRLSALVILTTIPLVVLLLLNYFDAREDRRDAGITESRAYVRNLGTLLNGAASDIDSYMSAAAVVIGGTEGEITAANTSPYLASLQTKYPNLNGLFITDLNGRVVAQATGQDTGFDVSSRPYMQNLKGGMEKTWTTQPGLRSGEIVTAYGRVVPNPDGTPRAYLVASFRPSDAVGNRPPGFPADGNLVIVDSTGRLIVSYRDPEVSRQPRDVSDEPLVAAAAEGKAVAEAVNIENSNTPFDEGKRYGALVPIPQLGWVLGFTRSQSLLDSEVQDRLVRDLGLLLGITSMTILVVVLVSRRMVSPLARLAAAAGDIAAGRRAEVRSFGADPDVRKLEAAFAEMSTAVAEREDRLREQARELAALEQVGARLASDLDYTNTVQSVTDAGTQLTEAEFGAFFYNIVDEKGESFSLYTLSGVDRAKFENFPMPRNTEVFAPTFNGAVVRLDDVTQDPRFGKNPPFNGMPQGHLPVRSYLAVPVFDATGAVLGGLFFGHPEPARFNEHHETLAVGIAGWASIAIDNARLYAESQHIQGQLREANAAKDEFLGLVSHELRTPTTTIYGGIRMLDTRRELLGPEATAELIHTMSEETERLVRLIENLLVFARLELGRMPDREPIALNDVVKEVTATFGRTHRNRKLETELAEALPAALGQVTSIEQVLTNFLSNADKYSPAGEPVTIITRPATGAVEVVVRDRGAGVPPDELSKIFESFYRSPGATKSASGHGLGLSVSKRIVEAHDGRIFAQNLPGGGFEIGFALPVAGPQAQPDAEPPEPVSVGGSA
jgi:signal transduction histidine kinase